MKTLQDTDARRSSTPMAFLPTDGRAEPSSMVVGRAQCLPFGLRFIGICAALGALGGANTLAPSLPSLGRNGQVAWIAAVALPGVALCIFSLSRIRLGRWWILVALAAAAIAALAPQVGVTGSGATLAKLVCASAAGFCLAPAIGSRLELVVIAAVITISDIASVTAGPSHMIVTHHHSVFSALTLQLHTVGTGGVSQLGMTDVLFFAGFLNATTRLGLRTKATWLAMTGSLAATALLANYTQGLTPALPLLAAALVIVNMDRLVGGPWAPSPRGH